MAAIGDKVQVKFHEKMQKGILRRSFACTDDDWWIVDLTDREGASVIAPERFIVVELPASIDCELDLCSIEERAK